MPPKAAIDPIDFRYILGYVTLVDVEATPRRLTVKVVTDQGVPVHTLTIPARD